MEIQYLKKLKDNPISYGVIINSEIKGISLNEIQQLEQNWNSGNPFPKTLKELLFLAGSNCYVCDYGINETQQKLQEWVREDMTDNSRIISRPFYAFDVYGGDQFLFIYLDEGDNTTIYEANPWTDGENWIKHSALRSLLTS